MNWSKAYMCWKKDIDVDEISTTKKLFFKTNPTEEQIMILNMQSANEEVGLLAIYTLGIISGMVATYVIWLIHTSMAQI